MSSSPSSSSNLVSSDGSKTGQKETLPEPCASPYGEWTSNEIKLIFRDVKPDPKPSMLMVQMIADAYEERRRVWEFHKDRPRQKGDNPAMYGPINEAQKNVEDFLVKWRFLSGPSILHKEASMVDKPVMRSVVGSAKELTILPSFEYRRHRTKNSLKPSVSMKVRYVLDNLHFRKMPQERSIPKQPMRKVVSVLPARRIFTALPRIDPGYKVKQFKQMSLRRMTRADSCALRACSVRKRKFTPAAEYEPTAEFLAELHPLPRRFILTRESCIQHDELKTLSWIQARRRDLEPSITSIGKTNVTSVHDGKSHTSPFISLVIYLLIQFTILVFCVIGAFVVFWTLSCAFHRCFQKFLSFVLDLLQPLEEDTDS
ncbi:hypothetical protein H2248_002407 [Termitomyces sp. 'cryptogamus']|nr:hypothetical protein H2248_002407 [Termitomyces sp. 'cryptogamus']